MNSPRCRLVILFLVSLFTSPAFQVPLVISISLSTRFSLSYICRELNSCVRDRARDLQWVVSFTQIVYVINNLNKPGVFSYLTNLETMQSVIWLCLDIIKEKNC